MGGRGSAGRAHSRWGEWGDRRAETYQRVWDVYHELVGEPEGWVGLRRLRGRLTDLPRAEVDEALADLARTHHRDVVLEPEINQKTLTTDDWDAAARIAGEEKHLLRIGQGLKREDLAHTDPVEVRIREAYAEALADSVTADPVRAELPGGLGSWVSIEAVRAKLGGLPRADVDRALDRMIASPDVRLQAELNQKTLTDAQRAAAVDIGGEDRHIIRIFQEE
jgi:hypothetical protein